MLMKEWIHHLTFTVAFDTDFEIEKILHCVVFF
jgi:hypothetical protein